ncbi:hypothetical protein H312_01196 [Anncaliia algerae PRA339]|uniref:RING-type domain-containing protein n=1 Tax=Anncaliia algerae PRA339 TaxID=1288291 RepID=A0A059F2I0_9MICR|nr:hypothetical protein H312_01196 [Anncaliia algerae PRA339]
MDENTFCPVCKSDSYLNPQMKLYISPCYHKVCEACLNYRYSQGIAPCPECGTQLRKVNYTSQTFEDLEVEKECRVRKKINKFLKEEGDFDDLLGYYDYLEEVENIVFDLLNKSDQDINIYVDKLKNEYRERMGVKRLKQENVVLQKKIEFSWLSDINLDEFKFKNIKFIPNELKSKNNFCGFNDFIMSYKSYHSLFNKDI